ncbi:hypothetical protein PFMALIP_00244 [Plasmodium falciparum MaliPS096_E11]|uniref:Uncharacterized protein n=1 Tax=Plasmodium falciparum MaliPS096_E11 TaxID=1036727 RepID=A0A024WWM3_PLAFA|nr:hypothetical protein PFMALIP_00244 [Plasmodium falciparum MaliPS096_E11]
MYKDNYLMLRGKHFSILVYKSTFHFYIPHCIKNESDIKYFSFYMILNEKKLKKYILLFIKTLQIHKYYNNYEFVFFKCMLR